MKSLVLFVLSFTAIYSANPEQVLFDAAHIHDAAGLRLVTSPDSPERTQVVQNQPVVSPPSDSSDYVGRNSLRFQVPADFAPDASDLYLLIEHLDTALALIQVTCNAASNRASAEPLAGSTCLGTNKPRHALFRMASPYRNGFEIQIFGAEAVRKIMLKDKLEPGELEAVQAEVPEHVTSRVILSRPMQFVTTVGVSVRGGKEDLPAVLKSMRELCPLVAALGFNGVESYVKWNSVEPEKGKFDWSFYDAVVAEAARHGLKWFPLLIVGSAYSLPQWYYDSPENVGFVCLEHGKSNNIQTIFCENQTPYVRAFLREFGKHYGSSEQLLGVRLGPSGNFGESQYPAGGNWGYSGAKEHIHIGWWAGDKFAAPLFQKWLQQRYSSIGELNKVWEEQYSHWRDVACFIPQFTENARKRKDFVDWYMGAMTDWCERWAIWAREAMPDKPVYQSVGGWGFVESGTDFTDQTASMAKIHGGVRATNETDSYAQDFQVTRMMSSAARFYGVPFATEPAGFNSAKGIASRIYNILINNGQHLFFYHPNLLYNDQGVQTWLELAPLLDQRAEPIIDVAVLYPDTQSKLDDGVFRNLYASSFYQRIVPLR